MSVVSRKLIAAASAAGLALSVATYAPGAPAQAPAKQRGAARQARQAKPRHAGRTKLAVLDKPTDQFTKSLAVGRHQAQRAAKAQPAAHSTSSAGGYPSPESLGVSSATLSAIAACESGGDPTAVSADGTYRGLYQFDYGTWASVGGSGDPAAASTAEQSYRAALLYARGGSSPWPICG